jgi:hypothetical protein
MDEADQTGNEAQNPGAAKDQPGSFAQRLDKRGGKQRAVASALFELFSEGSHMGTCCVLRVAGYVTRVT